MFKLRTKILIAGILRNLSSAGLQARKKMRDVVGLVDSLIYVIRLSLGKPGADAKVCLLSARGNVIRAWNSTSHVEMSFAPGNIIRARINPNSDLNGAF